MRGFEVVARLTDAWRTTGAASGVVVAETEDGRVFEFTGEVKVRRGRRSGTQRTFVRIQEVEA